MTWRRLSNDLRLQAGLVLVICALVYWPMLGSSGFSSSEGHRVIPGWEMRDPYRFKPALVRMFEGREYVAPTPTPDPLQKSIDRWLVPRMFGQPYLRKPPGMPWAIALSASILGESEWSARGVSALAATLAALVTFFFATRWFGKPWGLAAGLVHALTPWFWSSGRSAEIESLNNFATHAATLLLLDIMIGPRARSPIGSIFRMLAAVGGLVLMVLAKGPAGLPVIAAALLAAMIVKRSWHRLIKPELLAVLACTGAAVGYFIYLTVGAVTRTGGEPITQGIGDFMWNLRSLPGIAALPFAALGAGLPGSLALFFAWSPAGRAVLSPRQREAEVPGSDSSVAPPAGPSDIARALALTCLLSLAILMIAGVSNPRYAMPAMAIPAVLAAHAAAVAASGRDIKGTRLWNALTIKRAWIVPALLLIAAAVYIPLSESRRERTSGRAVGRALAEAVPDAVIVDDAGRTIWVDPMGPQIWADHMIEARPEVLLYAHERARELGRDLNPVWKRPTRSDPTPMPTEGHYLLLRSDGGSDEAQRYAAAGLAPRLRQVFLGKVHKFEFVVYVISPP